MRRVLGAALLAAIVLCAAAGQAGADVYDDNPAAASRGPGDMYVFARAADGAILERHLANGAWTEWATLGAQATSGPAAAVYGDTLHVFVRGPDGAVLTNVLDRAGAWSGWSSLGGQTTSAPSANRRRGPLNYFDLAVRGIDNSIYFQTFIPGSGWSGWASMGGNLTSAPAVNSQSDGIVNLFARGGGAELSQRAWTGAEWWPEWRSLAGTLTSAPSAISRADGLIDMFVRGVSNATYQRQWAPGWGDWQLLDATPIDSAPIAASDEVGHVVLFARSGDRLLAKHWYATTSWTAWSDFGPVAVPASPPPPPPPAPPPDGEVSIETGVRCTPPGGRLRVNIEVRTPKGLRKARVARIVFYTKGKGRSVRVDRKAPFVVRMKINRPAGSSGRVYARVYYRRSAKGKLHRKTVSRRYTVCR